MNTYIDSSIHKRLTINYEIYYKNKGITYLVKYTKVKKSFVHHLKLKPIDIPYEYPILAHLRMIMAVSPGPTSAEYLVPS